MKKIILAGLLLTELHTYTMESPIQLTNTNLATLSRILKEDIHQKRLNQAAVEAVKLQEEASTALLLRVGAKLPIFTAAKSGHRGIARKIAIKAQQQGLTISPKKRKKVLKRLILSGVADNLHIYFKKNLLTSSDITEKRIEFAEERASINPGNKAILRYLKRLYDKRKQQEKLKKEILFDQKECAV